MTLSSSLTCARVNKPAPAAWDKFRRALGLASGLRLPLHARFQIVLMLAAAGLAAVLIFSPKPWDGHFASLSAPGWADYLRHYGWWAALATLVVTAGLGITARWWAVPACEPSPPKPAAMPWWFWLLGAGAMLFLAWGAWPRMHHSLAHDERLTVRRAVMGTYRLREDGTPQLRVISWRQTFFYYIKPNNHVLHSVLARGCWSVWRWFRRAGTRDFEEWVFRLPAFLAGLAGLALTARVVAGAVSPAAGVLAAWLLALNPWYLRYTSEARGYALVMALTALLLLVAERAWREGRWRWWLAVAAIQFAMVHIYAGALFVLIVFNLGMVTLLARQCLHQDEKARLNFRRWLGSNTLAAAAAIYFILPLVPQYLEYLKLPEAQGRLDINWLRNTGAAFLSGLSWKKALTPGLGHFELSDLASTNPAGFWICAAGGGLLAARGCAAFWRGGAWARLVLAVLLLPVPLKVIQSHLAHRWVFEWYAIVLLPGLAALVAAGLAGLRGSAVHLVGGAAAAAIYGWFIWPAYDWMRRHPIEGSRDTVLAARGTVNPYAPGQDEILTISIQLVPDLYDPRCRLVKTPEEFLAALREADASGKPLFVMAGNLWSAAFQTPKLWLLVAESGMFDDFQFYRSFEPGGDHVVARYVQGAVNTFDAEAFQALPDFVPNADAPPVTYSQKHGAAPFSAH